MERLAVNDGWITSKHLPTFKTGMAQRGKVIFDLIEAAVGKAENVVNQHYLLIPTMYSEAYLSLKIVRSRGCVVRDQSAVGQVFVAMLSSTCI